jgi:hypothetical protein
VTKTGLFLTSFVAAVPGAILACLTAMAFVNYAGGSGWFTKALAGMSFLIGLLLTAMPLAIMVFAGPKAAKAPKDSAAKAGGDAESGSGKAESAESSGAALAVTDPNLQVVEAGSDELAMTGEFVPDDSEGSGEVFNEGDDSDFEIGAAEGDEEVLDFDDDDDEPKKGKKK